ncbi:MAG: nuclear transport factor 2 family protein [Ilumatobacteraceae bacterium]
MTTETSDIETVRAIYAAMAAGDIGRVLELVDPECVIVQDGRLPWGGRHVGHEGFATFGLALRGNIESTVTTSAMFAADGDVIQVGRTAGTTVASGTPFEIDEVHRWTIRDGRAVAAHFSIDTPAMLRVLGVAD